MANEKRKTVVIDCFSAKDESKAALIISYTKCNNTVMAQISEHGVIRFSLNEAIE